MSTGFQVKGQGEPSFLFLAKLSLPLQLLSQGLIHSIPDLAPPVHTAQETTKNCRPHPPHLRAQERKLDSSQAKLLKETIPFVRRLEKTKNSEIETLSRISKASK